jgi:probable HAF family extracellular repeat protein
MQRLMSMVASLVMGATIVLLAQPEKPLTIIDLNGVMVDGRIAFPAAINNRRQIAASTVGRGPTRALLWERGLWRDIGTFGQAASAATDINERGEIVGSYGPAEEDGRGFLWSGGRMRDLGTLPGATTSLAWAINNRGQITGLSGYTQGGTNEIHGYLWERGTMTDLGTMASGYSVGLGINDRGQIVGANGIAAFVWEDGVTTPLPSLGGSFVIARDINNRGQIVGSSATADAASHATLWADGEVIDLGTLPGDDYSEAHAINNRGEVVGRSLNTSRFPLGVRAFLWTSGAMIDLGVLPGDASSHATDINDRGDVVGMSDAHAVMWTNNPNAWASLREK